MYKDFLVIDVITHSMVYTWLLVTCLLSSSQEVHPNSPASEAGLCAHTDYIVGSDMMMSEDDFYSLVENSNHRELRLYVYNIENDVCREVGMV